MFPNQMDHPIIFEEVYIGGDKQSSLKEELITNKQLIEQADVYYNEYAQSDHLVYLVHGF